MACFTTHQGVIFNKDCFCAPIMTYHLMLVIYVLTSLCWYEPRVTLAISSSVAGGIPVC